MSAFIVSDDHINALVNYAIANKVAYFNKPTERYVDITPFNAEEVGRLLLDENVRSVVYRYEISSPEYASKSREAASQFKFLKTRQQISAVQAIKACQCLDYQSCETNDWEDSLAYSIVECIKSHAEHHLPGYDAAAWEIVDNNAQIAVHK